MKPKPIKAGPGQESVWDYPRPPRLEPVKKRIRIVFQGRTIADTTRAYRVLETSHPPVYYLPQEDIQMEYLEKTGRNSFCEWKGRAVYYDLNFNGQQISGAAWSYPDPSPGFEKIADHLAFYAGPMDACYVGDELVKPQPGGFYGGWITSQVVGPFKGVPGSRGW